MKTIFMNHEYSSMVYPRRLVWLMTHKQNFTSSTVNGYLLKKILLIYEIFRNRTVSKQFFLNLNLQG